MSGAKPPSSDSLSEDIYPSASRCKRRPSRPALPPRRKRSQAERRADRAGGVDRFGRPLPRDQAATFDPLDYRCDRCGADYELPSGSPRLIVDETQGFVAIPRPSKLWLVDRISTRGGILRIVPLAYRCVDEAACHERARTSET
jgi:hypothetical protein